MITVSSNQRKLIIGTAVVIVVAVVVLYSLWQWKITTDNEPHLNQAEFQSKLDKFGVFFHFENLSRMG